MENGAHNHLFNHQFQFQHQHQHQHQQHPYQHHAQQLDDSQHHQHPHHPHPHHQPSLSLSPVAFTDSILTPPDAFGTPLQMPSERGFPQPTPAPPPAGAAPPAAAPTSSASGNGKKRPRDSMNGSVSGDRRGSDKSNNANANNASPPPPAGKDNSKATSEAILLRSKKQKACSNCRRAKLKCIVEENETDCVRCAARKEKCIFYPRGHDEDWQQTLTSDMYNAIGHLTHLSAAVHHILEHLTAHGAIPPFEPPLLRFQAPERDLATVQGWSAERNRELNEGGRKRRKGAKKGGVDDDEDFDDDQNDQSAGAAGGALFASDYMPIVPPNAVRPSDIHQPQQPQQQRFERVGSTTEALQFQPGGAPQMPLNEVDIGNFNYSLGNPAPVANGGRANSTSQVTPDALASISPVDPVGSESGQLVRQQSMNSQPGGIFGLLNEPTGRSNPSPSSVTIPTPQSINLTDTLGSADPRPNIVKRGLMANSEALGLVNYFHSKLAQWLYGYRLEFGKFPYIPQGPSVITPFILSVMCLVASERVEQAHEKRPILANEVTQLLVNSPADSFITTLDSGFAGGSKLRDEDGEEELDPELGIGPEEIVGACILATFMTERDQAATIAALAFKWARGWIKWTSLTVPLPPTLGEVCGLLPIKRDATREDMARVWLLCYIVDGTEALQRDNPQLPRRDPMAYCHVLVPDSPLPGDRYSPYDILLTFHARLITLLRDWYHKRNQFDVASNDTGNSSVASAQMGAAHARLASSINASLEWWRADLESHQLDAGWMRHINLFWEFGRMLVNANSAKSLTGNPRLRAAAWAHGVEAALGFLEKSNAWPHTDELSSLPPCYLNMMTAAGSVLVDAIKDQGPTECPVQAEEALPLLIAVADMLSTGGLPAGHVARKAGGTLRGYADKLAQLV